MYSDTTLLLDVYILKLLPQSECFCFSQKAVFFAVQKLFPLNELLLINGLSQCLCYLCPAQKVLSYFLLYVDVRF